MYGGSLVMGRNKVEYNILMYHANQYSSKLKKFLFRYLAFGLSKNACCG
jgi:hypothetical protein